MNKKKYDAVATIGEYTTKSGEKKSATPRLEVFLKMMPGD
jgi:uncharacterized protein (UPF0218 family)